MLMAAWGRRYLGWNLKWVPGYPSDSASLILALERNEVDMTAIMEIRAKEKDAFLKKHGVKLGFMSFFVKGVVAALNRHRQMHIIDAPPRFGHCRVGEAHAQI